MTQPKKTETWEERWQKFIQELSSRQDNIGKMLAVSVIFKEEIGDFISQELTTTRLSAAAEERKRVCEEIERELPKKKETSGDLSFRTYDYNEGFNWAINKIEETIQSLKP